MFARLRDEPRRAAWPVAALLSIIWFAVYMATVSPTVNFIDSGELITALYEPGVAHPPGYPLYTLLGYVASHLPIGEVAWRVNAMSAFWGALAVGAFFLLIFRLGLFIQESHRPVTAVRKTGSRRGRTARAAATAEKPAPSTPQVQVEWVIMAGAVAGALLLGASSTFWSRTAQAKMYSLHYFLLAVLFLVALQARRAYDLSGYRAFRRWLVVLAATLGLSLTNHLMTVLAAIPLALLLVIGDEAPKRIRAILRSAHLVVLGFLLPLLLYLYMPVRAAQGPVMNWGSTDSWGDFWRHVTGWQFRAYIEGKVADNVSRNSGLLAGFAAEQWAFLTAFVVVAAIAGAVILARVSLPVFIATLSFAVISLGFDLIYGISEIEPYAVPIYAALCVWAGLAPAAWVALRNIGDRRRADVMPSRDTVRQGAIAAGALIVLAVVSAGLNFPRQDYSGNRLAEQFVRNVFSDLPEKSIVITDYWDFYAPTYYLQLIEDVRPDVVLIDMSLLRYPWYSDQLTKRYPWLMEKSRDILDKFAPEQRRWVNGEPYDSAVINTGYFDLLTSFVDRNYPEYTPFVLWLQDCAPAEQCDTNLVARQWTRQPAGLAYRLWPPGTTPEPPPEPSYELAGITHNPVPLDTFAKTNSEMYRFAYLRLADLYERGDNPGAAARMTERAREVANALSGR